MELKTKAIVLKSAVSGDKDVLVTLFCIDYGIIKAKLRSAKGEKAKLKFAKEQFCFADFVIAEKNGFYTIIQADVIDTFYSLVSNYDAFMKGSEIFKIVLKVLYQNQANNPLFISVLKSIKTLAYDRVQPNVVLAKFLLELFFSEGYLFSHSTCSNCNQKLGADVYLDFDSGEVLCFSCKTPYSQRVTHELSGILKVISATNYDNLHTLTFDEFNLENVVLLLSRVFEKKF
ncbi:MAG: DNA repair protein RecO [Christensenellales bacterium]|jgi:DNA repair protein RecO (recombination protein O)